MNNLKENIIFKIFRRVFYLIVNVIVLAISLLIPKTNEIIVVGGWFGKRFTDNSKYFYLYANNYKSHLGIKKVIWITRNNDILNELKTNGYSVYKAWSFFSVWYHLRARIHVVDQSIYDINPFFSVRSVRINLWHGFPLKKIVIYSGGIRQRIKNKIIKKFIDYSVPGFWGKDRLDPPLLENFCVELSLL